MRFRSWHKPLPLVPGGEKSWSPYGTVGKVYSELPSYVARWIGMPVPAGVPAPARLRPADLNSVIESVEGVRRMREHSERDNESLVEGFFAALGYVRNRDIVYRRGRVDIRIENLGQTLLVTEVKAAWNLSYRNAIGAIKQAYGYAHDQGVRYVLVTNGDNYMLFDRLKGLSYESQLLGEFQLTSLQEDDLELVNRLRPGRLNSPDLAEALRHLAESFERK